jgi:signal transduction histidine kinase
VIQPLVRMLSGRYRRWLIAGVLVAAATLAWASSRAITAWRASAVLLAERRAEMSVDLLVRALTRDMRGVQSLVLPAAVDEAPGDLSDRVSSVFARYPYPEAFFSWRADEAAAGVTFFSRSDRPPAWMPHGIDRRVPVVITADHDFGRRLLDRITKDAANARSLAVFDVQWQGVDYQVIAQLSYRNRTQGRLAGVFGFLVDLAWVRQHYFAALTEQVAGIETINAGLAFSVLDETGATLVGTTDTIAGPSRRRPFPLLFFDPVFLGATPPADLTQRTFTAEAVVVSDPTLTAADQGARQTLVIAAIAALGLGAGFLLTLQAAGASESLARMRAEFIIAVTHELKTPIASIRAMSETLASGRSGTEALAREYGTLTAHEAKRLGRLIDNVLTQARMTEVDEAHARETLSPDVIVDQVLHDFASQLESGGFDVDLEMDDGLPAVRVNRRAIELALGNLIDNAIRYSDRVRVLRLGVHRDKGGVTVNVADKGRGIPADELTDVQKKFVRGRGAPPGGTGLGLAIAQRIVADHGGRLDLTSRVGEGTTVHVWLPAAQGQ